MPNNLNLNANFL